jgi:hypothetical protein
LKAELPPEDCAGIQEFNAKWGISREFSRRSTNAPTAAHRFGKRRRSFGEVWEHLPENLNDKDAEVIYVELKPWAARFLTVAVRC